MQAGSSITTGPGWQTMGVWATQRWLRCWSRGTSCQSFRGGILTFINLYVYCYHSYEIWFVRSFINLFDSRGVRADPRDTGGEYRSVIGLPGGMQHPAVAVLRGDAAAKGMRLVPGAGDEGDTLAEKTILVYDSNKFPFYAGELYHQFHDDVVGTYGRQYASLRAAALERGTVALSPCPGDSAQDTALEALQKWGKTAYEEWRRQRSHRIPSGTDF